MQPERFVLDTDVFDAFAADGDAGDLARRLIEAGRVEFLVTHVQVDQLTDVPDPQRRKRLLNAVPYRVVSTSHFVVGVSRISCARIGDEAAFGKVRRRKSNEKSDLSDADDALIAATAEFEGVRLVSNDKTLRNRVRAEGGEPWSSADLVRHLKKVQSSFPGAETTSDESTRPSREGSPSTARYL